MYINKYISIVFFSLLFDPAEPPLTRPYTPCPGCIQSRVIQYIVSWITLKLPGSVSLKTSLDFPCE